MANPTPVPVSERYFAVEISKAYFLPAIADAATGIPTRAEITAGTDLTDEIADLSGWQQTSGSIAIPDFGHRFVGSIPGRKSVADSTITFHADLAGVDIRSVLAEDQTGFVVFADGGDVPTYLADAFPVRVSAVGKVRSTGDSGFQIVISFTITKLPAVDFALPANP